MSELFGEASVRVVPDLRRFAADLQRDLKEVMRKVETGPQAPKVRIKPALTKDFIGDLRRQVNAAVARAEKGIRPISVASTIVPLTRRQAADLTTQAQRAINQAGGIPVTVAPQRGTTARAPVGDSAEVQRAQRIFGRGVDLSGFVESGKRATKTASDLASTAAQGARAFEQEALAISTTSKFVDQLARATREMNKVQLFALGTADRARQVRVADRAAVEALATAQALDAQNSTRSSQARISSVQTLRGEIRQIEGATQALGEHDAATNRAARSASQLRRGVLSTTLSFLGIRGATLAASAQFLAGAAAIAVFAKALDNATRFADQLNVFRATTSATGQELERVRDTARALGADLTLPGVTASDAAEAMTELAKAGLSVEDSLAGARGVLQLATAAAIDNAQAVELAANAINAFGLAGADATHVADVFANAANAAQGSIVDIGIAFQQSAAAGRQVGLSFEDTAEFLTVLARSGLRGSDAGTSLRTALIRLINPSKEAAAKFKELGINVRDASGNLRPDVFIQLAAALSNVAPAQRDATIALIGGQDAFRAISILGRQSIRDFIRLRRELRQQGTAQELAAARTQGLRGSLEALSNSLSTIGVRVGTSLTPALQGIVDGLSGFTAAMANSQGVAQAFGGSVDFLSAALTGLGATLQGLGTVLGPAIAGVGSLANSFGVANIIAAVAAFKLLSLSMRAIDATRTGPIAIAFQKLRLQLALFKLEGFASGMRAIGASLAAAALSTGGLIIGLTAVSVGLFALITRETEAERVTRRLTQATDDLVDAQGRLREARRTQSEAGPAVNRAQLDLLNAQRDAAQARGRFQSQPRGTQERVRAAIELRVAVDNVRVAELALSKAQQAASDSQRVLAAAAREERKARADEISGLRELGNLERDRVRLNRLARGRGGRSQEDIARREVEIEKSFRQELQKRIDKLREAGAAGDVDALNIARRLELLKSLSRAVGDIPTDIAFEVSINSSSFNQELQKILRQFGKTGRDSKIAFLQQLALGASPELQGVLFRMIENLSGPTNSQFADLARRNAGAYAQGWRDAAPEVAGAVQGVINRAQGRLAGIQRQGRDLQIQGASLATQLANARQEEAAARAILARLRREHASAGLITNAQNAVIAAQGRVTSLEGEIASAQKEADDARAERITAHDERVQNQLARRRRPFERAVELAKETETLEDDISAIRALRRIIHRQIRRIRELITDKKAQIAAIQDLQKVDQDLADQQRENRRQRRQQIKDRIAESIQLDIDFFNTIGNANAEIRARLREIARLKKLQAATKRGTVEYRRYRNLIAEQEQAIKDLTEQQKDLNAATSSMQFEFLQMQSGFVANLLGNLIPMGATGGLVSNGGGPTSFGGPGPITGGPGRFGGLTGTIFGEIPNLPGGRVPTGDVGANLAKTSQLASATGGPTRGGQQNTNHLLQQILRTLLAIQRGDGHPEAHHRRGQQKVETSYLETRH